VHCVVSSSREGGYAVSSTLKGHSGTIRAVKFNNCEGGDACSLASGGAGDCRLRLWDVQSGATYTQLHMPSSLIMMYVLLLCVVAQAPVASLRLIRITSTAYRGSLPS
jgi:WD40 repeat protein